MIIAIDDDPSVAEISNRKKTIMDKNKNWVTGLFDTRAEAETAVDALIANGCKRDEITVLMSDSTHTKEFAVKTGTKAAEGAGVGGAVGGTVGAVLGAVVAVGTSIAVPGIGLLIAGPLAAALAGASAGVAVGGLVGLLVGAGIPEERAKLYEAGLRKGGIMVGVEAKSDDDADRLEKMLEGMGSEKVHQS